jgi:hypothetical protein
VVGVAVVVGVWVAVVVGVGVAVVVGVGVGVVVGVGVGVGVAMSTCPAAIREWVAIWRYRDFIPASHLKNEMSWLYSLRV